MKGTSLLLPDTAPVIPGYPGQQCFPVLEDYRKDISSISISVTYDIKSYPNMPPDPNPCSGSGVGSFTCVEELSASGSATVNRITYADYVRGEYDSPPDNEFLLTDGSTPCCGPHPGCDTIGLFMGDQSAITGSFDITNTCVNGCAPPTTGCGGCTDSTSGDCTTAVVIGIRELEGVCQFYWVAVLCDSLFVGPSDWIDFPLASSSITVSDTSGGFEREFSATLSFG